MTDPSQPDRAPHTTLTEAEVDEQRRATPGIGERIHFNHAGSSLPTNATLRRQIDHLQREARIGGYEAAAEAAEESAGVYEHLAALVNADSPHEIARFEHATAAWNAAFWSIPMRPGQRIVTAEVAYGANAVGFIRAAERHGITIDVVPSTPEGEVDVDQLATRLDDDVAVVAITHIPTNGGLVNPAERIGALTRAAGIPFLLDACQSVGHLDIDVQRIGCDMLTATGRKYLRGPRGTGFAYVAESIIDSLTVDHPDHHGTTWDATRHYSPAAGARRFEYWEFAHAGWLALGTAAAHAVELGPARIEATIRERAGELRHALADIGLTTLDLGTDPAGIVTTTVPGMSAAQAKAALAEAGINVSVAIPSSTRWDAEARGLGDIVRISVHYLTTHDEIEALCGTVSSW